MSDCNVTPPHGDLLLHPILDLKGMDLKGMDLKGMAVLGSSSMPNICHLVEMKVKGPTQPGSYSAKTSWQGDSTFALKP